MTKRNSRRRSFATSAASMIVALCVSLPTLALAADPESAGFSARWLDRIGTWYQSQVNAGAFPGAVVAIARKGKLAYLQAIGTQDRAAKVPLKPDSIFWIASMTKPVTSVAAMMLVEEGKLDLAAPVSQYLPELADRQVAVEEIEPATGKRSLVREPAKRQIEVIDLLRHTSGLVYPEEATDAIHRLYSLANFRRDRTLAEFVSSLSLMPLAHQPGEVWEYSWGVDVLARVVEVASGQPFDEFLHRRLFKPLGMVDTGFYVPEAKLGRLVDPPAGGRPLLWDVTKVPKLFSGGGGLVSTAPDYLRFCEMLLNGGELDGVRILSAQSVKRMTTDALPAGIRFAGVNGLYIGPSAGSSWGLGFAIRTNPDSSLVPGAIGSFSWSGAWGTYFWIDPVQELIGIQMIQISPEENHGQYRDGLRHLTYAALLPVDPGPPPAAVIVRRDVLQNYVGKYLFGRSLSAFDRQAPLPAFAGIGLQIDMIEGWPTVRSAIADTPAAKAGLLPGDVLTEIDGRPLKDLTIDKVVDRLRGQADTEVHLRALRQGTSKPLSFAIVRRPIHVPGAEIEVKVANGELVVEAIAQWSVLDFAKGSLVPLSAASETEFFVESGAHTRLAFIRDSAGKISAVVLNRGDHEIMGQKIE